MYRGYFTDIENAKRLGLTGTTLQVYSTLRFLCQNQPWKKKETVLADMSGCGSASTASRAIDRLIEKGLLTRQNDELSIVISRQNDEQSRQNDEFSKEKEKNQKNKENKKVVVEEKDVPSQPQQPIFIFNPPTWEELVTFGTQKNIPISLIKKFYAYYTANNWMLRKGCKMENWKGALTYWKETEKKGGQASTQAQASVQAQASYAGSQYANYLARQQQAKLQDELRQADDQHRYISYDEYKKTKG